MFVFLQSKLKSKSNCLATAKPQEIKDGSQKTKGEELTDQNMNYVSSEPQRKKR